MSDHLTPDLADFSEFRQSLLARPPAIVHGTALLLVALLGTALAWAALTPANLVVRATGRVRPVTSPRKVVPGGESAGAAGRVVEVNCREGDEVRRGDVLVRLDTQRLDNDAARRRRSIRTGEDELAELDRLAGLLERLATAGLAKAEAEVAQARDELGRATERQGSEVRLAERELHDAADEESVTRRLAAGGAAARMELSKAETRSLEAREKLNRARQSLDASRVEVTRRALELTEQEHAMRRNELTTKRQARQGEVDAARLELANLELERQRAVVCAPADGVVVRGDVKVGDLLDRGQPVVEIAEQMGFRFEAAVPSEEVGRLDVGLPVRVKLDAFDHQRYGTVSGRVCFISPDSGTAEGRPASYTVRIELDGPEVGRGDFRGRVKLGMAGTAEIVTGRESVLSLLVKRVRQTISLD